ncbi:methyl-accepting chemotaxis protein [Geomonas edaphica]|uniref:methyl-accepting chemotaxis protein n=1 Tax=Geomonas edaphica TaxID=2570226 RepID=UPI0010A892BA|nr:methyl-accepting chemotaxis protein [Geomonas edaphica]
MSVLQDVKLAQKFGLVGGISAVLLCLSLAASVVGIKKMSSGFTSFVEKDQAIALALKDMYAQGLQTEQATRNILLNPADEKAAKNYTQAMDDFEKAYGVVLTKSKDLPKVKGDVEQVMAVWKEAAALRGQVQSLAKEGKKDEALTLLVKDETPKWREVKDKLFKLSGARQKEMEGTKASVVATSDRALILSLCLGVFAIFCTLLLLFLVAVELKRTIRKMSVVMDDIAMGDGDLTKRLEITSRDELGHLAHDFNLFLDKMHGLIATVAETTHQVSAAAAELNSTAEQMASGTEEVASQAVTVASAGEEMTTTSSDIARNCTTAAEGARRASDAAVTGAAVVQETVQGMGRIAERVRTSAQTVESLGTRSDQIGEIVGTIEEIADQTNLLALNAAIEAARAGEQGRGFAVVADEVRALAERTTRATGEIGNMIKSIQAETRSAVSAMDSGVKEVEKGTQEAARSGEALQDIISQIDNVTQQVSQIAVAAEEQTATTGEISGNIHQITAVVHQTAQGAQQSAQAAGQLSELAERLRHVVDGFKL